MRIIDRNRLLELYFPVIAGLVLAVVIALLVGIVVLVMRQTLFYSHSPWEESKLYQAIELLHGQEFVGFYDTAQQSQTAPTATPQALDQVILVSKSQPIIIDGIPGPLLAGILPQISVPLMRKTIGVVSALITPSQQFTISQQPETLSQRAFPFADARAMSRDVRISRIGLTNNIKNFEPVDELGRQIQLVPSQYRRLYWFNELKDMSGERVFHSWYFGDVLMSRVEVMIKSASYRASSYKTILPHQQGQWRVVTETLDEKPLASHYFEVVL